MAFLSQHTLACKRCGLNGPLTWLIGKPRASSEGSGKGYVKVKDNGDWMVKKTTTETIITCPDCGTEITRRSLTP